MLDNLKQSWEQFKGREPGERFRQTYEQRQKSRPSLLRKALFLGAGVLIFAAGLFFLPAPGPGTIILFVGAGLIAQESLLAARALDWAELRLRRLYTGAQRLWSQLSPALKVLLVLLALAILAALAFGGYKLLFAR